MVAKSKAKAAGKAIKKDIFDDLHNIKSALSETGEGVKSRAHELVSELLEDLQDRSADYQETIEEYVSNSPLKSLGIAIAVGLVFGKFFL